MSNITSFSGPIQVIIAEYIMTSGELEEFFKKNTQVKQEVYTNKRTLTKLIFPVNEIESIFRNFSDLSLFFVSKQFNNFFNELCLNKFMISCIGINGCHTIQEFAYTSLDKEVLPKKLDLEKVKIIPISILSFPKPKIIHMNKRLPHD